jgi:hypothetical protein
MSFFNKKKESAVPDLPFAGSSKVSELPSLPGEAKDYTNTSTIKMAVEDSSEKNEVLAGETIDKQPLIPVLPPILNGVKEEVPFSYLESSPQKNEVISPKKNSSQDQIFVRIDKFDSAKKDLEEIQRELKQIDSFLGKIKELKQKEDEKIGEFGSNLEEIKTKISRIDSEVFNRI